MFHGPLDYFQKPPLGGRPNTKPGDHGTLNTRNCWFILYYHTWGPAWIEIHWNSIWLRVQSHMASHNTWGSVITLHDFGGVLDGLWTLSFGLSQFQGHGSWLVCEVVQNAAQFSSFPRLSINRKLRNIKGRTSYDEVVETNHCTHL